MTEPSPSFRHPVLLSLWAGLTILTGLGLSSSAWFIIVFLVSPIVAIGTFAAVSHRGGAEVLRPGWSIVHRIVTAGLALASIAGVFASAGRLVEGALWYQNGPIALLFLLTFFVSWRTVVRPTPRRAAIPAMVVHITWLPLIIANEVMYRGGLDLQETWAQVVAGVSLISILALSAVAAVLALVGFRAGTPIAPATVPSARGRIGRSRSGDRGGRGA